MDIITMSKTLCCDVPVTPCSAMPVSATTSCETSCETSQPHSRWSSPERCDPAELAAPCPSDDGVEFDDDESEDEVRLPNMRLRTDSGIGMPVWDSLLSPASQEPAGDEESPCRDSWPFGMAVSPVPMVPLAMPPMPPLASPSMSAGLSPMMPPPAMASFYPPCASPNGDGHVYAGQSYNQAWTNDEAYSYGYDGQAYSQAFQNGDGHNCSDKVYSQSSSAPRQNRKRASKVDDARGADVSQKSFPTTICFRNLPNNYSTKMVLELLDQNGFKDGYDFVYVPHDFKRLPSLVNVGYFFVNFISHDIAVTALNKLVGFKNWTMLSTKVLGGSWAAKTQGKNACRERCKYFTFMHEDIPDECKPMMFDRGVVER